MICLHIYFREKGEERRGTGGKGREEERRVDEKRRNHKRRAARGGERILCARYYSRFGDTTMNKTAKNTCFREAPICVCVCVFWGKKQ